jgi:hypothetical protein
MYAREELPNIKYMLLDYLNGDRPNYTVAEFKIISTSPLTIADSYSNTIKLNMLEPEVQEQF